MASNRRRSKPSLLPIVENRRAKVCDSFAAFDDSAASLGQHCGESSPIPNSSSLSKKGRHLKSVTRSPVKLKDAFVELMVTPRGAYSSHSMGMVMWPVVDIGGHDIVSSALRSSSCTNSNQKVR
uniref:Uncharacterized protein n=1 Tax=Physcomitrium patens TaxID=3218 RepID=A0A2K1JCC3_PHYPA|nr:hypothetical protein PHYPA_019458 [Physcomitrium patens]